MERPTRREKHLGCWFGGGGDGFSGFGIAGPSETRLTVASADTIRRNHPNIPTSLLEHLPASLLAHAAPKQSWILAPKVSWGHNPEAGRPDLIIVQDDESSRSPRMTRLAKTNNCDLPRREPQPLGLQLATMNTEIALWCF